MGRFNEKEIIAEAEGILGTGEEILAAGYFGLHDLIGAQIAGCAAVGLAGSTLDATSGAIGAGLGGAVAVKAYAESRGVTVKMIVAVTADSIHVLNRDTGGRLPSHVATFDRQACHIDISKFGLSRIIALSDTQFGGTLEIEGGVNPISALSKGDKAVLKVLAA